MKRTPLKRKTPLKRGKGPKSRKPMKRSGPMQQSADGLNRSGNLKRNQLKRSGPIRPKPKPTGPESDDWRRLPYWLEGVRLQRCIHCGHGGRTQAAHVRTTGAGGVGVKPPDCRVIPLCDTCHAAQHAGRAPTTADCFEHLLRVVEWLDPAYGTRDLMEGNDDLLCERMAREGAERLQHVDLYLVFETGLREGSSIA